LGHVGSLVGDMKDSQVSSLEDGIGVGFLWVGNFLGTLCFLEVLASQE